VPDKKVDDAHVHPEDIVITSSIRILGKKEVFIGRGGGGKRESVALPEKQEGGVLQYLQVKSEFYSTGGIHVRGAVEKSLKCQVSKEKETVQKGGKWN